MEWIIDNRLRCRKRRIENSGGCGGAFGVWEGQKTLRFIPLPSAQALPPSPWGKVLTGES